MTNQLAVLQESTVLPGFEEVKVHYDEGRNIVIQGQTPKLDENGESVMSKVMDSALVDWVSAYVTVTGGTPSQNPDTGV